MDDAPCVRQADFFSLEADEPAELEALDVPEASDDVFDSEVFDPDVLDPADVASDDAVALSLFTFDGSSLDDPPAAGFAEPFELA